MPDSSNATSPWIPAGAASFIERHAARFDGMTLDALDAEAHRLIAAHEQLVDHDCINLYAGTNIPNPRGSALLASTIGSRPNLGHPGAKYNNGMQHAEQLEVMLSTLLKRLFKACFVEHRVGSASLAAQALLRHSFLPLHGRLGLRYGDVAAPVVPAPEGDTAHSHGAKQ